MASPRPSPGLSRATLKPRAAVPGAAPAPAASLRARAPLPRPSPWRESAEITVAVVLILGLLIAGLGLVHFTRDSMAVGRALAEQGNARGSMICKEGRIARGDGSLHDLVFADGVFVCTDWRTLQAVEQEEAQKGIRR